MGLGYLESLRMEEMESIDLRYVHLKLSNPFRHFDYHSNINKNVHPVEQALYLGRIAHELEDLPGYKKQRAIIPNYLEPQYQRIVAASTDIRQFIKENKRQGEMFDYEDGPCWCCDSKDYDDLFRHLRHAPLAEALVYLEQYAAAFRRDVPIKVLTEIKKQKRHFDRHYFDNEREQLLFKMNQDFEMMDYEHYVEYFKRAFNDMEQQRLEIQKARKELFKFDLANDRQCDINADFGESEDLVDWEVYDEVETENE
ncbi:hypothetical protein N431DRAFT_482646 [Stipitochalara longipes BDJ]|nr:hypothetical protein N431DRAFT_482646 [Stipitochalara longipes BDJ]